MIFCPKTDAEAGACGVRQQCSLSNSVTLVDKCYTAGLWCHTEALTQTTSGGLGLKRVKFRKFRVEKRHLITINVVLQLTDFL